MSLPFRYTSSERYVQGTVRKLECQSPTFQHLNIGRYYLTTTNNGGFDGRQRLQQQQQQRHQQQNGHARDGTTSLPFTTMNANTNTNTNMNQIDNLTEEQLDCILSAACTNPYLNELTLCGIEMNGIALERLTQLLHKTTQSPPPQTTSTTPLTTNPVATNNKNNNKIQRVWKRITFIHTSLVSVIAAAATTTDNDDDDDNTQTNPCIGGIRLKQCQFDVSQSVAIQKTLTAQNSSLHTIEFIEENLTDPTSIMPFALGLAQSTSITTLEFSYCTFSIESMTCLANIGLSHNKSLESILLPGCELDDNIAVVLIRSLSNHPNLKHLKLFRNHCGPQSAIAIADLLRQESPTKIEMTNYTDYDSELPSSPLSGKRRRRTRLESLDLSYQQFERSDKFDIQPIAASLTHNTTLRKLVLSFNKLNDDAATKLAIQLKNNHTLEELDLRANNIRDDGITSIAKYLVGNASTTTLTTTTTTTVPSPLPPPQSMSSGTTTNGIKKLSLFGNPFVDRGGQSLLLAMQQNTTMMVLNMEYHLPQYETIQFYICLNRMGRHLLKHGHQVHPAVWPKVLRRANNGPLVAQSRGVCTSNDLIFSFLRDPAVFGSIR